MGGGDLRDSGLLDAGSAAGRRGGLPVTYGLRRGQFERQPRVCTPTPAHTSSTTRTQSLEPSLWAEGYDTERLEFFGSEAEITVYVPFVGSYQRSRTFRPAVIALVSTVIPRRVGK